MTQLGHLLSALVLGLNSAEPREEVEASVSVWAGKFANMGALHAPGIKKIQSLRPLREFLTALATGSVGGVDLIELGRKNEIEVSES
ncbi:RxLR-like protein [Plasmopara halstedii]|uniref:RxLR-like protein n=1 Tax=Plasmopara halstedii TaxID=4781 RepID=A0A0P1AR71_PLAHL|nr:RxLR-like protein [Plasmopara halstedii]CEG43854.1 RxLR-like protein [Plasmopara halstedii]|eukprot:XP_024580223.1 RxLR-like protein [Plasmopara halstedii]